MNTLTVVSEGPVPGIAFPCNGVGIERDDDEDIFASDKEAAYFLSALLALPIHEEDEHYYLAVPPLLDAGDFMEFLQKKMKELKLSVLEYIVSGGTTDRTLE